jgi:hypothetical protein
VAVSIFWMFCAAYVSSLVTTAFRVHGPLPLP